MTRQITELTRRDIFGEIQRNGIHWAGRLEEPEFLGRLFDLKELPSDDGRYRDVESDIWQHRVNNCDWDDDWIFWDDRFDLLHCDDETLLKFLCETVHPLVRVDPAETTLLIGIYNRCLQCDGYQIEEDTRVSGKPVYVRRRTGPLGTPAAGIARAALSAVDAGYVQQQLERMEDNISRDPALAIGTAKEFVETCCRTILNERDVEVPAGASLQELVKKTSRKLEITPADVQEQKRAAGTIRRILGSLGAVVQGVAELRNSYGTGHGREAGHRGLGFRHAKLAVGAASTLGVFLIETHRERDARTEPERGR